MTQSSHTATAHTCALHVQVEAADLGRDDESDALNERGLRARLGIERDVAAGRGEASNRAPTELYRKANGESMCLLDISILNSLKYNS